MYLFEIYADQISLAKAEIENLLTCKCKTFNSKYFIVNKKINVNLLQRLAYTKSVFQVLSVENNINDFNYKNYIESSYKITIKNLCSAKIDLVFIYNQIYSSLKNPIVDLKNPQNDYIMFFTEDKIYLSKKTYKNLDSPSKRRAHLRKELHPTSLHPKQARAMINLVAKKEFLDCFCGSGGIVLEGALMNLNVFASDISRIMVNRTKINLETSKLNINLNKIHLETKDALLLNSPIECIVTDFPFGKNSYISKKLDVLFQDFLLVAKKITNKIVIGHLDSMNILKLIEHTPWKIDSQFDIYVHKNMTRKITKLII